MTSNLSRRDLWRSLVWVIFALGVLAVGAGMHLEEGKATLAGLTGPPCPLGSWVGEDYCPGCGLTRSTALAVQGDLADSWASHPAGWAVVLLALGALAVHGHILVTRRRGPGHDRWLNRGWRVFVAILFLAWIYRML